MEMLFLARQRLDPLGSGEVGLWTGQTDRTDGLTRSLERSASIWNELQEMTGFRDTLTKINAHLK